MSSVSYTLKNSAGIGAAMSWLYEMLRRGLAGGPVVITLGREKRSLDQNAKQWAMLEDIRKTIPVWHGHTMTTEDYKDLLSAAWKGQTLVPGVDQGFVALGVRTSRLNKADFSELIELYYAFGSQHNVQWSEQSLAAYAEYRELQREQVA